LQIQHTEPWFGDVISLKRPKIRIAKIFRGFSGLCVPNQDVFPDLICPRNPNRRYDKQICSLQPSSFFYPTLVHLTTSLDVIVTIIYEINMKEK